MKTIWKFTMDNHPKWFHPVATEVQMPAGAKVVNVAMQGSHTVMWAMVDTTKPLQTRSFVPFNTGEALPLDQGSVYLETVQVTPTLVHHWYEIPVSR